MSVAVDDIEAAEKLFTDQNVQVAMTRIEGKVDPARFGEDRAVIYIRRGRNGVDENEWEEQIFGMVDTMTFASHIARLAERHRPDAINIDVGGLGVGVYDRLAQLGVPNVNPINFADKATRYGYANMRAQMWDTMKENLKEGVMLPGPEEEMVKSLRDELTAVQYDYDRKGQLILESKEDIKKRLGDESSPDIADALALTYALPVFPSRPGFQGQEETVSDYDPI